MSTINISFEKVISLSKKYATMADRIRRIDILTEIISGIIHNQGTPNEICITLKYLSGEEIVKFSKEIFEDLEIAIKPDRVYNCTAIFLVT